MVKGWYTFDWLLRHTWIFPNVGKYLSHFLTFSLLRLSQIHDKLVVKWLPT